MENAGENGWILELDSDLQRAMDLPAEEYANDPRSGGQH